MGSAKPAPVSVPGRLARSYSIFPLWILSPEFTAQLLRPLYYRRILLLADTLDGSRRLGADA